MQVSETPVDFQQSYLKADSYPENLLPNSTYTYTTDLLLYRRLLDLVGHDLFLDDAAPKGMQVSFRDLQNTPGKEVEKINAHDPLRVSKFMGILLDNEPGDPATPIPRFQRRDPESRFIYIKGQHSRAALDIKRDVLRRIFSYHEVMPVYLDFIFVFGAQTEPRDRRFSGFREQSLLHDPPRGLAIPDLGRSGRKYQLCYNLKTVTLKSEDPKDISLSEWSTQPAAIYHQFDVIYGTTLWIVTKGGEDLLERYKALTGKDGRAENKSFGSLRDSFRSSLAPHLMFCHWSTENWRWYVLWLESIIEKETSMAILGLRGRGYAQLNFTLHHLQDVQAREDQINEAVMVLEANVNVMQSLQKFYENLRANRNTPQVLKDDCADAIDFFNAQVNDMISNMKLQIGRAQLLVKITKDRKELIIQLLQSQAAERMEELNLNMEREAVVVRIITIVTLIYLPATFVSTFFSTDIVRYQDQAGGPPTNGIFSTTAMYRWLQVTLPLTFITLVGAFYALKLADGSRGNNSTRKQKRELKKPRAPAAATNSSTIVGYHNV